MAGKYRIRVVNFTASGTFDAKATFAQRNAGDPGPVVLRRLSNAEYTYTIRDLTGVTSLDPAKEFPADSASGEGFMNVGNSLVMSPALLTKYLDAAKEIANHAVLLPDGIAFSASTSSRDWTEEKLAAIRAFYGRDPDRSYFDGCSDGGREALMEAQRFPDDFNGILAGAPANNWSHLFTAFVWNERALLATLDSAIPPAKLPVVQRAVMAACDRLF